MLADKLKDENSNLAANRVNGKCTIQCSNAPLFLGRMGELLGETVSLRNGVHIVWTQFRGEPAAKIQGERHGAHQ